LEGRRMVMGVAMVVVGGLAVCGCAGVCLSIIGAVEEILDEVL